MSQTKIKPGKGRLARLPADPIEPEELARVIELADNAARSDEPADFREVELVDRGGNVERLQFTDTSFVRGYRAIWEYCAGDQHKFRSLTTRMEAYFSILHSEEAQDWLLCSSDDPESTPVAPHPAILDAAATLPIRTEGQFRTKGFFLTVEQIARTKYPEFEAGD